MAKNFQIIQITVDEARLKAASNRLRKQFVGCMHAHNELAILNRLLMFAMNATGDGQLHNSAQSVQMWCVLQLLVATLYETWVMLNERFLKSTPPDVVPRLKPEHQESLQWLTAYFGKGPRFNDSALKVIRDKTAFHYDAFDLTEAVDNLAVGENSVYLAQHPANSLYYVGSALVFRGAFAMIADKAPDAAGGSHEERVHKGTTIAIVDARNANWHMHQVLYGLINLLMNDPDHFGIPTFIDIGRTA
jgi:hypothetical protein